MVLTIACKNTQKEPDQKAEETTTKKEEVASNIKVIKFALEPKSDSNFSISANSSSKNFDDFLIPLFVNALLFR